MINQTKKDSNKLSITLFTTPYDLQLSCCYVENKYIYAVETASEAQLRQRYLSALKLFAFCKRQLAL